MMTEKWHMYKIPCHLQCNPRTSSSSTQQLHLLCTMMPVQRRINRISFGAVFSSSLLSFLFPKLSEYFFLIHGSLPSALQRFANTCRTTTYLEWLSCRLLGVLDCDVSCRWTLIGAQSATITESEPRVNSVCTLAPLSRLPRNSFSGQVRPHSHEPCWPPARHRDVSA